MSQWYIEPGRRGETCRVVTKFPFQPKDAPEGEVRWMKLRDAVYKVCLQLRGHEDSPPVEVVYSQRGGWKMKFPPTQRGTGKWVSTPQRGQFGSPDQRWEEEGTREEAVVTEFPSLEGLVGRLVKMGGLELAAPVVSSICFEAGLNQA